MSAQPDRLPTETAHVLFMDLVGYSRLPMEEQARLWPELREVVRETCEYRRAEGRGELIALDSGGDGLALVFFRDPTSPVQCAVELAMALQAHPRLRLRMGVHSGPVSRVADIHGQENVSGAGINMAQRVMDCGEAGHILLSSSSAEMVGEFESWKSCLHDLGDCEVKHGARLRLFNFFVNEVGNPRPPVRLHQSAPMPVPQAGRSQPPPAPDEAPVPDGLDATGGAVPLRSSYYIERRADAQFKAAVARGDSIVLVKGPRQIGKTSLLARGLQQARESGARVVLTDMQKLTGDQLLTADALFQTLAETMADQLDLDFSPETAWNLRRGWNVNFERFLRREVLARIPRRVVWGLDEVDRLFACPFGGEVFGLFRSWHNERSLDPQGPWSRLTLAIAYATEAHLFITDLNQSPFNVGTRLTLEDFTVQDVAELNTRYGSPLAAPADLQGFCDLVGGHPYLAHRGLALIADADLDFSALQQHADHEDGPFGDHLRRLAFSLSRDAELAEAVRSLLRPAAQASASAFYRLRSAGVVSGESPAEARLRCRLYEQYLRSHLL